MKKSVKFILILSTLVSSKVFAYGLGMSTHPYEVHKKVITTEATGTQAKQDGTGGGIQARYYQRLNERMNLDGGFGVSSAATSRTFFFGSDYMILQDYDNQPRFSLKGFLSNNKEQDSTKNNIGIAPTLSKGFNANGHEFFPFIALPMAVSLDWNTNNYKGTSAVAIGSTAQLPFSGFEKLTANLEANLNLKNAYNSVFLGLSYPLN